MFGDLVSDGYPEKRKVRKSLGKLAFRFCWRCELQVNRIVSTHGRVWDLLPQQSSVPIPTIVPLARKTLSINGCIETSDLISPILFALTESRNATVQTCERMKKVQSLN